MKTIEIYFEDIIVTIIKVKENYNLCFNSNTTEIMENGKIIASIPHNYLIVEVIKE